MSRIFSNPRPQFIKSNGEPNAAGKIYFYEPGVGSSTLKSVYSDYLFQSALTNPVILDGNGKTQTNIFLNGDYKWVVTDSAGVTIETGNNYDPPELGAQFGDWDATITYAANDFVRGSNGSYFQSLSSGNVGNNPVSAPQYWVQKFFQDVWNQYKTYSLDDIVKYGGSTYVSIVNNNTGNQPDTSTSNWRNFFESSSGSFTGTITGVSGTVNGTVNYTISSSIVSLSLASSITGTSNATAMSLTGLPSAIRPARTVSCPCDSISDSGVLSYGRASVVAAGTINFSLSQDNGAGRIIDNTFAGSGTKGLLAGWSITYPIE